MNAQIFIYCVVYIIRLSPPCTLNNDCRTGGLSAFRAVIPARFQRAPLHPMVVEPGLICMQISFGSTLRFRLSANTWEHQRIMPGSVLFVWLYWSIFIVLRVPCAPCVIIINSGPHRNCACMIRSAVAVRKCMLVHFLLCCVAFGWEGFGCLSTC